MKLEVSSSRVKVFIIDATEPCLVVKDLKHGKGQGPVGLWAWDGYFANSKSDTPNIVATSRRIKSPYGSFKSL